MNFVRVSADSRWHDDLVRIYETSFPSRERVSLEPFFVPNQDRACAYALVESDKALGFLTCLISDDLLYLFYLAVDPSERGQGIGSKLLGFTKTLAANRKVFLDCEAVYPGATDMAQRQKRLDFYEKNGFSPNGPMNRWRGDLYLTLSDGGEVTHQMHDAFWEDFKDLWPDEPLYNK